ncbi:unnamed protein product (macronuclear) [Paramecium tetraurelia]|uniref:Uncharacterized protein n=1 Tax=Paramecium tetraurelia TaxID=5888 RepID=A0BPY5_PARTE|nr:uncharacterized protein GSPATT00005353001 [Paramecium tetraurelia]CAK60602.1 unnamed protein product [Paramecium tetraurelia]|eukprot:XP_001428000.1 hypothetical protein (macronuclear) [Paramecium tetraurelia strain d4-2]
MDENQKAFYFFSYKSQLAAQSTRSQISLSQSQEQASMAFQSRIKVQNRDPLALRRKLSPAELIPLDEEILELYDDFSRNYKLLGHINQTEPFSSKQSQFEVIMTQPIQAVKSARSFDSEELFCEQKNKLVIARFKFYYFRLKIKGRPSPLSLCFNFIERVMGLKIYLSTKVEFPSSFNADQFVQSKYATLQSQHNHKKFHENYLYISLHCETDTRLNIKVQFGKQSLNQTENIAKKQKSEVSEQLPDIQVEESQFRRSIFTNKDKIVRNLNVTQNCMNKKFKFLFDLQSERISKLKSALQNKKIVSREFQISKLLKYQARQIIPEYRKYERTFKQRYSVLQQLQINWLQTVFVLQLVDSLNLCLNEIKKAYHIRASGMLLAWRWKLNILLVLKRNGNTIQERSIYQAKMVLKSHARHIKKTIRLQATQVLHSVLTQTLPVISLKNRMIKVRSIVLSVQVKFRWLKNQKRLFYDRFWKNINQLYLQVLTELQNKGKQMPEKPVLLKRPSIYLIDTYC